ANNTAFESALRTISDRSYWKAAVKGRTALRDAILQAIQLIEHPTSADAVLVLTDGDGDNASKHKNSALIQSLDASSVRVFSLLASPDQLGYRNRTPEELEGASDFSVLARNSGGEILSSAQLEGEKVILKRSFDAKITTTEEALQRLYQTILHNDLLEIELPGAIAKRERFELKLVGSARARWKNAQLTYPEI